jgi:hypothetical protein
MKEGYEKYCRNGLCEGESRPKRYKMDEHHHEDPKDKCWYSGCQCPGERLIVAKEEQKQHLIDMIKDDEELGLYDENDQAKWRSHLANKEKFIKEIHPEVIWNEKKLEDIKQLIQSWKDGK